MQDIINKTSPPNWFWHLSRTLTLLLLFPLLLTCVDEIDLDQGEELPEGIVVQGRLNVEEDQSGEVEVRLQRLFRFEGSNRPEDVIGADILLENTEGQTLPLRFINGAYRLEIPANDPSFRLQAGLGYRLTVGTREGEAYETDFDLLPPKLPIEELTVTADEVIFENPVTGSDVLDTVFTYRVDTPLRYPDGSPARFRWTVERTWGITDLPTIFPFINNEPKFCYVTQSFGGSEIRLFNGAATDAQSLLDFPAVSIPIDFQYSEGNYTTIYQEALSREAFVYFDQIAEIANVDQSIFNPPAGPVVGNARDVNGNIANVFGFFYATNRTSARVGISRDEAGSIRPRCPLLAQNPSPNPSPTSCDDCLRIDGATLTRPSFWEF